MNLFHYKNTCWEKSGENLIHKFFFTSFDKMPCNYAKEGNTFFRQEDINQFSSFLECIFPSFTSFTTVLVCPNSCLKGLYQKV